MQLYGSHGERQGDRSMGRSPLLEGFDIGRGTTAPLPRGSLGVKMKTQIESDVTQFIKPTVGRIDIQCRHTGRDPMRTLREVTDPEAAENMMQYAMENQDDDLLFPMLLHDWSLDEIFPARLGCPSRDRGSQASGPRESGGGVGGLPGAGPRQ